MFHISHPKNLNTIGYLMVLMETEQLNLKLQKSLYDEIEIVSKVLHIQKNEWARNILAHEVKKELEEHRHFLVREYLKGTITKKELISVLGAHEVKDIDRIAETGKRSFDDAIRLAKEMK